jgi:hypothetical protein
LAHLSSGVAVLLLKPFTYDGKYVDAFRPPADAEISKVSWCGDRNPAQAVPGSDEVLSQSGHVL